MLSPASGRTLHSFPRADVRRVGFPRADRRRVAFPPYPPGAVHPLSTVLDLTSSAGVHGVRARVDASTALDFASSVSVFGAAYGHTLLGFVSSATARGSVRASTSTVFDVVSSATGTPAGAGGASTALEFASSAALVDVSARVAASTLLNLASSGRIAGMVTETDTVLGFASSATARASTGVAASTVLDLTSALDLDVTASAPGTSVLGLTSTAQAGKPTARVAASTVLDLTSSGVVELGKDYGVGAWLDAIAAPTVRPRMLVVADSLTEAMGTTGPVKGWPHQLRPDAQTVFIPPAASWGGTYNARQYKIGDATSPHLTPESIRTTPSVIQSWWATCANATPWSGSYTYLATHTAGLSNIRVLFTAGPDGYLDYKWGSGADVRLTGVRTWHGDVKIADVPAGTGALQFNYSGENYTIIGILGDIGTPEVEVMNLSRSGAMVTNWNEWMSDGFKTTNSPAGIPANLARGFAPHLVQIASGGNEYWQNMPTETFKQNYRDLVDRLVELCPDAGFLITNQPPGNVADTPLAQWDRIQTATAEVAAEYGIPVVDWRNLIPSPENDTAAFYAAAAPGVRPPAGGWYSDDDVHPTDEGSRYAADLTRDMLALPKPAPFVIEDGFDRAALGADWVVAGTGSANVTVDGSSVGVAAGGNRLPNLRHTAAAMPGDDCELEVTVGPLGGNMTGFVMCRVATNFTSWVGFQLTPTAVVLCRGTNATSNTVIGSVYSTTVGVGTRVGIRAVGTTLELLVDGQVVRTATDATHQRGANYRQIGMIFQATASLSSPRVDRIRCTSL